MTRASPVRAKSFVLLAAGVSIKELCERMGICLRTAYGYRTEWRRLQGMNFDRSPLKRDQVVALDAAGVSPTEIARRMGISVGAVSAHRRLAGLPALRAHETIKLPDLGRCKWCGLSNPCTCTGPRHATDHMGRRDEPVIGSAGL